MSVSWLHPLLFGASFLLTHLVLYVALHQQWLDVPNARSSHVIPTPKGGGLGFAAVFTLALFHAWGQGMLDDREALALALCLPAALLGLLDDLFNLNISTRITAQGLLALAVLACLAGLPPLSMGDGSVLSVWIWLPAALALVWLINLYNFMDGIDGLAALEALFVCLAGAFFAYRAEDAGFGFLLLALAAAIAGFLPLNLPRARIFMGDAGSTWLGLVLGTLGLISAQRGVMHVWAWAILLGVFVSDASLTLLRRFICGEVWYHAHRSHAYQQAARVLGSHGKVDLFISLVNFVWLFPLAWISLVFPRWALLFTLIAYIPLILLGFFFRAGIETKGEEEER